MISVQMQALNCLCLKISTQNYIVRKKDVTLQHILNCVGNFGVREKVSIPIPIVTYYFSHSQSHFWHFVFSSP